MNTSNTNTGGWRNSYMRNTLCPAFLNAMPNDWRDVITACIKYSDNTGGGNDTASYVTATSDKIWLSAESEVFGSRSYANSAEKNYQKQYDYYRSGNSKLRYRHRSTHETCAWLMRSVSARDAANFCMVNGDGVRGIISASLSIGFAPCFMVA